MAPRLTLRIRSARGDDLPRLLDLLEELRVGSTSGVAWDRADDDRSARTFDAILADPHRAFLVAEADGQIVGTADVVLVPNLTHASRPVAYVENVVVAEGRRGEGIGRALMDEAIRRAEAAGCYKIQLLSNDGREGAHVFYDRLGFERSAQGFRRYLD